MKFYIYGCFAFCLVSVVYASSSSENVQLQIIDYGVYEQDLPVERITDHKSATGFRSEGEKYNSVHLKEQTIRIPLKKNTIFGFRAKIIGVGAASVVPITVRYDHPQLINQAGVPYSFYEYNIHLTEMNELEDSGLLYRLSEDYELVSGEWKFSVRSSDGKLLVEKTFILGER